MRDRLKSHFDINTQLSMMSDKALNAQLRKPKLSDGWGQNGVVNINGQRVFVKSIPVTERELRNAYSTKNHYNIPAWYNYGVGSAGFGAFRELAAHVKTTNWVRDGQCGAFPLLHHHRIVAAEPSKHSTQGLENYVTYWNGSKTIERYMQDRIDSKHQLLLFLEYLEPASDWMLSNPSKTAGMFRKAINTIDFVHKNSMIHFDAHVYNWLTDGREMYLTDFGLLLDREFELTKTELQFFTEHKYYDYAQVVETFGYTFIDQYFSVHDKESVILDKEMEQSSVEGEPRLSAAIRVAFALHESKQIKLPSALITFIRRYKPIIDTMNLFFLDLRTGKKASDKFPARKMLKKLRQLDIVD